MRRWTLNPWNFAPRSHVTEDAVSLFATLRAFKLRIYRVEEVLLLPKVISVFFHVICQLNSTLFTTQIYLLKDRLLIYFRVISSYQWQQTQINSCLMKLQLLPGALTYRWLECSEMKWHISCWEIPIIYIWIKLFKKSCSNRGILFVISATVSSLGDQLDRILL